MNYFPTRNPAQHYARLRRVLTALTIFAAVSGCATRSAPPTEFPLANSVRSEIGHLAVRGPSMPKISLTADLDNRSQAAGRAAGSASSAWIDAMASGSNSGDGAVLVALFGLAATPLIAAGGAVYGASTTDSAESVAAGNAMLKQSLHAAPDRFLESVKQAFSEGLPIEPEFVEATTSDAELISRGYDSVLDLRMDAITSRPAIDRHTVLVESHNTLILSRLGDNRLLASRNYATTTTNKQISRWASGEGSTLMTELTGGFAELSEEIADDFFRKSPIGVAGVEPKSRRLGFGQISGTRPLLVWKAWDAKGAVTGDVEYEIQLYPKGQIPASSVRILNSQRYAPGEPLKSCQRYFWRVRGHYASFGQTRATDWSPEYRFRTPCK